ncbi:hypothetical protein Tco_0088096 [Tanacetum coccineum]
MIGSLMHPSVIFNQVHFTMSSERHEKSKLFLALEDDPTSPEVDDSYYDLEGDILLLESFLNGDDKLPVIIAKDLSVEEKAAFIKVLKSLKRAIAWKLFQH